jgi:sialate O-acetylesterase
MRILPLAFSLILLPQVLRADVTLPAIFSEHMVLQRSAGTPVWGKAAPNEKVAISLTDASGALAEASATADAEGRWRVNLDLSDAKRLASGTPYQVVVEGANTITIPDVLIGEVWLASGQSNMAFTMKDTRQDEEIAASANNEIRFFTVGSVASLTPKNEVNGKWTVASPDATRRFSAVAY